MAASKPKKEKKGLAPSHVKHLKSMMDMARNPAALAHPLVIPPPDAPSQGFASQQVGGDDQLIPAKTGEYIIPEPVVRAKGTQFFDNLIKKVLQDSLPPAPNGEPVDPSQQAGTGTPTKGYKWGGEVTAHDEEKMSRNLPAPVQTQFTPARVTNYQDAVNDPFELPPGYGGPDVRIMREDQVYTPHELRQYGYGGLGNTFGNPNNNPWINPNYIGSGPTTQNPFGGQNTRIPTFWNPQGIPYAVPVTSGDVNVQGGAGHGPQEGNRKNQ